MTTASHATSTTPRSRRGAHYDATLIGTSISLQTITGELDAANAAEVSAIVESNLSGAERLILDLRGLTFFGTHGFSAVHRVNVICSLHGVDLVLVAGTEVDRILRICDPGGGLPVARSLDAAITAAVAPPPTHLRLVSDD